jgi:hypothetical protein
MKFEEELVARLVEEDVWSPNTHEEPLPIEELGAKIENLVFNDPEFKEKFTIEILDNDEIFNYAFNGLLERVSAEMEREIEVYQSSKSEEESNNEKEFRSYKKKYLKLIKKTAKEKGEDKPVAVQFNGIPHPINMKAKDFCDLIELTDKYDSEIQNLMDKLPLKN